MAAWVTARLHSRQDDSCQEGRSCVTHSADPRVRSRNRSSGRQRVRRPLCRERGLPKRNIKGCAVEGTFEDLPARVEPYLVMDALSQPIPVLVGPLDFLVGPEKAPSSRL